MMIRIDTEFLDFNELVEVDKRSKLFEEIDQTAGDFSYSFDIPTTGNNLRILGFPFPDVANKAIYQELKADLMDDSGVTLYKGVLLVSVVTRNSISCSFLSGNYNWFSLLNGPMTDIDYSEFNIDITELTISDSWDNTEGVIFPFIDAGAIVGRSFKSLVVEDFIGCLFVKTIFKKIFKNLNIKLKGDFINDTVYDSLLLATNNIDTDEIDAHSMYANKTADEPFANPVAINVLFQDDFTLPYFDGSANNYDASTSTYTADVKEKVRIDATIIYFDESFIAGGREFGISINGVFTKLYDLETTLAASNPTYPYLTFTVSTIVTLDAGDALQPFVEYNPFGSPGFGHLIIRANSTFKVTPIFIYHASGKAMIPKGWTNQQFVSNIFKIFCCITDYEPVGKVLTIDLFENVNKKEPINVSDHIEVYESDFHEMLDGYAQVNELSYEESDADAVKEYNISNFLKYGNGQILVDNFYIDKITNIVQSDFKAPISYEHPAFTASVDRMEFLELESEGSTEFTSVTDSSGDANFNMADDSLFDSGDVVEISESTVPAYNGQYIVKSGGSGAGFVTLIGVPFSLNGSGTITKMNHVGGSDDGAYLLINTKYRVDSVAQYSRSGNFYIDLTDYPNVGYAYFNLLNLGLPINEMYKQSLSFGQVNSPLFYQRTIIDKYWNTVGRILNDPVKLRATGNIPKNLFLKFTPLRPLEIKTLQSSNMYYMNLIRGYKGSEYPCEIEMIKLS